MKKNGSVGLQKQFVLLLVFWICSVLSVGAQIKFDFDFSFNKYQLYNGERLTMTPKMNNSKSPVGASFVKVKYYWDGDLISTETQSPFNLDYQLRNHSVGKHTLKVAVYATGTNLPTFGPFNYDYTITILESIDNKNAQSPNELMKLGDKYYNGEGVEIDYVKAFDAYKKAAELDNTLGQYKTAYMYQLARGTTKDLDAAIYWYKKSANSGFLYAWWQLGLVHEELSSYIEALSCFKQCLNAPDEDKQMRSHAKFEIGKYYDEGLGVSRNLEEAINWYKQSADDGYEPANKRLEELGGHTNPSPTPIKNLASISWLVYEPTTKQKDYSFRIGIKSDSKIEDVTITVNGAQERGIKTVLADGYDLTIDRTLTLSEGINRIVVSVRNEDGIVTSEKVITYQSVNQTPVFNDKRYAFVVGNSHYSNPEMNLANPENDAKDVAEKLKGLGFEVVLKLDATLETMDKELSSFKDKAKDYDVAMFYYAGHGIQNKGENYIIPTNIENLAEDNLKYKCVNMERVLDVMEDSQCKLKIVVLDACRNDPVSRKWHRSTGTRGLSIMNAPVGTIVSFSTSPNHTALDGTGRNSPYAQAFLNTLDMPNLDVFHFFQKVGASVLDMTKKAQNPWLSVSFTGDFYFNKQ